MQRDDVTAQVLFLYQINLETSKQGCFDRPNLFKSVVHEKDMLHDALSCRHVQFRPIPSRENILSLNQPAVPFPTVPLIAACVRITTTLYHKKPLEALPYRSSTLTVLSIFGFSYLLGNRMTRLYHYVFFTAFQANTSFAFAVTEPREVVSIRTGTITPLHASLPLGEA